jgi:hypothetical protein
MAGNTLGHCLWHVLRTETRFLDKRRLLPGACRRGDCTAGTVARTARRRSVTYKRRFKVNEITSFLKKGYSLLEYRHT